MKDLKVRILITSITLDQEDVDLTVKCYNSFHNSKTSFLKDIMVDTRLHPKDEALTKKWNEWTEFYLRTQDYDYLINCANDTVCSTFGLEYLVRLMEENKDVDFMYPTLNRDWENFQNSMEIKYNPILDKFNPNETANYIARKGVFEKVGLFDMLFVHEKNEQDWLIRAKKMGVKLATTPMKLFYHPNHSQDDPNRQGLSVADKNWNEKWGATWFEALEGAGFQHPFNNPEIPLTKTKQN